MFAWGDEAEALLPARLPHSTSVEVLLLKLRAYASEKGDGEVERVRVNNSSLADLSSHIYATHHVGRAPPPPSQLYGRDVSVDIR